MLWSSWIFATVTTAVKYSGLASTGGRLVVLTMSASGVRALRLAAPLPSRRSPVARPSLTAANPVSRPSAAYHSRSWAAAGMSGSIVMTVRDRDDTDSPDSSSWMKKLTEPVLP